MRGAMSTVWDRMRNSIRGGHERLEEESIYGAAAQREDEQRQNGAAASRSVSTDYTELMGGSVPCPSCKGTGRIPKEMEETLVALIPVNDDRLKPKRTWMWVTAVVAVCLLVGSGLIYMLVPRSIELHSLHPSIDKVNVTLVEKSPAKIEFHFMNYVNVSNANYYAVEVTNTTATIINKFQPWNTEVIGTGINATSMSVSPLNDGYMNTVGFNNTVTLENYAAQYCTAPFSSLTSLYVNMQFDVVVTIIYFNHKEQISLSIPQTVCCIPTGNCTTN